MNPEFEKILTAKLSPEVVTELRNRIGYDCTIETAARFSLGLNMAPRRYRKLYTCRYGINCSVNSALSREVCVVLRHKVGAFQSYDIGFRRLLMLPLIQVSPQLEARMKKRELEQPDPREKTHGAMNVKAAERFKGSNKWEIKSYSVGKYEGI